MIFRQRQESSFGFELPPQPNPPFIYQRFWSPLEYSQCCCFSCMIATLDKGIFVALSDKWFLLDTNQFNHNFLHKFLIFTSQGIHGEHQSSVEFAMKLRARYLFWFIQIMLGKNDVGTKFGNFDHLIMHVMTGDLRFVKDFHYQPRNRDTNFFSLTGSWVISQEKNSVVTTSES